MDSVLFFAKKSNERRILIMSIQHIDSAYRKMQLEDQNNKLIHGHNFVAGRCVKCGITDEVYESEGAHAPCLAANKSINVSE